MGKADKKENPGKKSLVLARLFKMCQGRGNFVFNNDEVRKFCEAVGFKNQFDVTKLDNREKLPAVLRKEDYAMVHLGKGRHKFVKGVDNVYHAFEEIAPDRAHKKEYRKSILNKSDDSESNMLSMAFNHGLLHEFLYGNPGAEPKVYNARRTRISGPCKIGGEAAELESLQVEIDMTFEHGGTVTVFEGKTGFPDDFAIYQLYNPYRYYHDLKERNRIPIKKIECCYVLRGQGSEQNVIRVHLYKFTDIMEMSSIKPVKNAQYTLLEESDAPRKIQK